MYVVFTEELKNVYPSFLWLYFSRTFILAKNH